MYKQKIVKVLDYNDKENIKKSLDELGYVAINVMSKDEALNITDDFWLWLENLKSGIDRNNSDTWLKNETFPEQIKGIINSYGIGQSVFMWKVRTNHNIIKVFQDIWETNDLITSFDGACIYPLANDFTIYDKKSHQPWPHRDQSPYVNEKMCIQGALNLYDNLDENDGGLIVWEKSHSINWLEKDEKAKKVHVHWYRINEIPLNEGTILRAPAGTLFLWDSRTVHENIEPCYNAKNHRAVALVCMCPRIYASHNTLSKRYDCFINNRTTSHLPHQLDIKPDILSKYSKCKVAPKETMKNIKTLPNELYIKALKLV